jgi:nucleotide-binding universal stress UspA family protein
MMIERVLLGINDSAAAHAALRWVIVRATGSPTSVELIHAFGWYEPAEKWPAERERLDELGARIASAAPDTAVTAAVRAGSPEDVLLGASAQTDLLVIGAHRSRVVRSALAGSLPGPSRRTPRSRP